MDIIGELQKKINDFFKILAALGITWQFYAILIFYALVTLAAFYLEWQIGVMLLAVLLVVFVFLALNMSAFRRRITTLSTSLSRAARVAQDDALYQTPIGVVVYDEDERVRWNNPAFQAIFGSQDLIGRKIEKLDDAFISVLKNDEEDQWKLYPLKEGYYRLMHEPAHRSIYLFDVTKEEEIRQEKQYDQIVFAFLFLDDYLEVIETMDDQQVARFDAVLLDEINEWANRYGIYIKRLDEEKFILLFNQYILRQLEQDKFSFFDELSKRNHLRNVPISISMGVAYSDERRYRIDHLEKQAQVNLELALGRGGDQIVVRAEGDKARFYGGKTNPTEKRTNIRSRLVYQALISQIEQAEQILITGHKSPDTDSLSSSLGIYKIVKMSGKEAKIILDQKNLNSDLCQLLELPYPHDAWNEVFMNEEQVEGWITPKTLIIMVDHHRPSLSEAQAFLSGRELVIIDHHRQGEDYPANVNLSYIEVYASSTAEMITEFFMNMHNTTQALTKFEATALLSGIIVDTNNFVNRTGSRTFDAASYLKSRGASTSEIQRILKEDIQLVLERNRLMEKIEFLPPYYALTQGQDEQMIDNITAAQTADEMLTISNVEASFVIYRRDEQTVGISARSLGKVNVQTIMERLGGGGHLSTAATQLHGVTIVEAHQKLIESINYDKGEE